MFLSYSENDTDFYKNVKITSLYKEYLTASVKIKLLSVDVFTDGH